jgi:ATP-dependent Clp protease ATP-binding subunit ClpA
MEHFTQRAQRVMALAEETAVQLKHPVIGTEHVLVGLLREEHGVASRVLRNLSLKDKAVVERIVALAADNARIAATASPLELSSATKRLLELAVDEAHVLDHHYIGTEHVLLGLVRQEDSAAVHILKDFNITPEQVRRQTQRLLQEPSPEISNSPDIGRPAPPDVLQNPPAPNDTAMVLITKILEMVGDNQLSAAQANEILRSLHLDLTLTPTGKARFANMVNSSGDLMKRRVQITVYDPITKRSYFELTNSLDQLLSFIDHFLALVSDDEFESLVFDGDNTPFATELRLEKGETES